MEQCNIIVDKLKSGDAPLFKCIGCHGDDSTKIANLKFQCSIFNLNFLVNFIWYANGFLSLSQAKKSEDSKSAMFLKIRSQTIEPRFFWRSKLYLYVFLNRTLSELVFFRGRSGFWAGARGKGALVKECSTVLHFSPPRSYLKVCRKLFNPRLLHLSSSKISPV